MLRSFQSKGAGCCGRSRSMAPGEGVRSGSMTGKYYVHLSAMPSPSDEFEVNVLECYYYQWCQDEERRYKP